MLAVGQPVWPIPEFQQMVQGYVAHFYAEAQRTAQRAAGNSTKLAEADVNLNILETEMAQNERTSAARIRHLKAKTTRLEAQFGSELCVLKNLQSQMAQRAVILQRVNDI